MARASWYSVPLFAAVLLPALLQVESCEPAANVRLAVFELWVGPNLDANALESFDPNALFYRVQLAGADDTALLRVEAEEGAASIAARYDDQLVQLSADSEARLDIPVGISELRVDVSLPTDEGRRYSWAYTVSIWRDGLGTIEVGIEVEEIAADGGADAEARSD